MKTPSLEEIMAAAKAKEERRKAVLRRKGRDQFKRKGRKLL